MLILTKYLGPTDFRGSRIKATAVGSGQSVTVSYDYAASNPHDLAALALVAKLREGREWLTGGLNVVSATDVGYAYVPDQDHAFLRVEPSNAAVTA